MAIARPLPPAFPQATFDHDEAQRARMCMQQERQSVIREMVNMRRLATLQRFHIKQWKLPFRSIVQLEQETDTRLARRNPGICGMMLGSLLVQTD